MINDAGLGHVGGGIALFSGNLTLKDDAVSGNAASGGAGGQVTLLGAIGHSGAPGLGGGLFVATGTVSVLNSTFAGNEANGGAGGTGGTSVLGGGPGAAAVGRAVPDPAAACSSPEEPSRS